MDAPPRAPPLLLEPDESDDCAAADARASAAVLRFPSWDSAASAQGDAETDSLVVPAAGADSCDVPTDVGAGLPEALSAAEVGKQPAPPPASCCHGLWPPKWFFTADWMAGAIGVASVNLMLLIRLIGRTGSAVPHFQQWAYNPLDALYYPEPMMSNSSSGVGGQNGAEGSDLVLQMQVLAAVMAVLIMGAAWVTGTLGKQSDSRRPQCTRIMFLGWMTTWLMALVAQWLSQQKYLHKYGIEDATISMLLGMLITELHGKTPSFLKAVAAQGEWQVKIGLTCMVVRLSMLSQLGLRGFLTGWVGKPLSIVVVYKLGTVCLGVDQGLAMLLAAGISWCGATAISAVAPIVQSSAQDTRKTAATGVIALGVIPQTFALGYLSMCLPGSQMALGAWLGLSVDQTGNVLVAGQIADNGSHDAEMTAATVKLIMNAGLGLIVTAIGVYWEEATGSAALVDAKGSSKNVCRRRAVMLWDNFPKFIIGFLINCVILSWYASGNDGAATELQDSANKLTRWWMTTGFAGIGLNTDRRKLCEDVKRSGGILSLFLLWLLGGLFDNVYTYGLAYLGFEIL